MPTLTIDSLSVTVPEGTNVLEAAKRLGIVIPHFCYHEALGAVGACRLCAMKFLEGPVKGVQMSCMVEAKDGMVVSTLDEDARDLRSHVIEWLMMNHPHDCPVCDEGGECQLQDMTVAGGHGIRRFRGLKRTYPNQDLGPFIEHEMNRCIQCYRCVRTYQDYCGGTDFGVMGANQRIYFGRFREGRLESPFSGNIVDACPTGVFTDKTFRFRTRYWDLEQAPSVCPHCSLGCSVIPGGRYRELQRTVAGVNLQTNGHFICDRGRFGYGHANHPGRPRAPRIGGNEASWPEALVEVLSNLTRLAKEHGPDSVAFIGSTRASLEANFLLKHWAEGIGTGQVVFEVHPRRDLAARTAAALPGTQARSLEEIRRSDFLLLLGADPLSEGPMLALAVRQAVRKGARAAILDPRPVEIPCVTGHLPLSPEALPTVLEALESGDFSSFSRQERSFLEGVSASLKSAERPVLIGGADLLGPEGVRSLLAAAVAHSRPERPCGAMVLLAGPNSFGAARLAGVGPTCGGLMERIADGRVRALVCLETDPLRDYPDQSKAESALAGLEFLAVLDCVPSPTAERADVFLPTTVPAEGAGVFVNNEGRMLPFETVLAPGLPIRVTGNGDHPPRGFEKETPGALPRPAWAVLAALTGRPQSLAMVRRDIEKADPRFAGCADLAPGSEGRRVSGDGAPLPSLEFPIEPPAEGGLRLLPTETLFGSELLSSLSPPLDPVRPEPFVLLHVEDAQAAGIAEGDKVALLAAGGRATASARLSSGMARGVTILPRLRGTPLETFVPGGGPLPCRVEKEGG
jgi:NADH-quinone oxidoreductase subunit G